VELGGGDADLGAEAELVAVGEAGGGVDQHGAGVDLADKPLGMGVFFGDDRLGVERAVTVDMVDRLIQSVDNLDCQDQVQILRLPVLFTRRQRTRGEAADGFVAPDLHLEGAERIGHAGDESVGDVAVHEQGFQRVADPGTLGLGVDDDLSGHGDVGRGIDKDVANAFVVLDDRDAGVFDDEADQAFTAAGDDQVDRLLLFQHLQHPFALGEGDQRQGRLGNPGPFHFAPEDGGNGDVGVDRLRTAAQDDRISRFQAECGGIGGDIGARFVDNADHPERDAHFSHLQAVGPLPHPVDAPYRVGEQGDFAQAVGHPLYPGLIEQQPVDHGIRQPLFPGGFQVFAVFGHEFGCCGHQGVRHGVEQIILGAGREFCQVMGRLPCPGGDIFNAVCYGHWCSPEITIVIASSRISRKMQPGICIVTRISIWYFIYSGT